MTESLHALSGAYVVDALDDDERAMFERHLPTCVDCQAEVDSLREAAALMSAATAVPAPPSLRASVLAGIATVRPLPPLTAPRDEQEPVHSAVVVPLRRHRFRLGALAAAAAVLAVVGVGAVTHPWTGGTSQVQHLSAADQVIAASDAQHVSISFKDGSNATVVRSPSEGRAVLLTEGMAQPPSQKVYELWLRKPTGQMVPAGLLTAGGDSKTLLTGDASKASAVGITVEPQGGSSQPTSTPIAMFDFDKAGA